MFNFNKKALYSALSIFFIMNIVFADPTDGCEMDANTLFLTSSGDVFYNSDSDIAGFQFTVDGATASGASGGDAAGAGFTVQAANITVLGFSFTGGTIPAG